jgi:UDP-N-acetylmuramate--alanine ligase
VGVGLELGIGLEAIKDALADYRGAKRRLEIKFEGRGLLVIDDYAHHPTEIKATLNAADRLGHGRMIAVFQPHRYTRTHLLMDEFSRSFTLADCVVITDIYAASEPPIKGVHARALADKIKALNPDKEVVYLVKEEIPAYILKILKKEDLVITLGAGDIVKVSDELAERLKSQS